MHFKSYFKALSVPEREIFAVQVGSSRGHLQNIAYGFRECSPILAVAIERVTNGMVRRQGFFPSTWQAIWPELVGQQEASTAIVLPDDALGYVGEGVAHG